MLADLAKKEVAQYFKRHLDGKFPNGGASVEDVAAELDALCDRLGFPGAASLKVVGTSAQYTLSDPMTTMMMAARIKAESNK